jgi:hypothetical protein
MLLYMFRAPLCPSSGAFDFVLHSQPPVSRVVALVVCSCRVVSRFNMFNVQAPVYSSTPVTSTEDVSLTL